MPGICVSLRHTQGCRSKCSEQGQLRVQGQLGSQAESTESALGLAGTQMGCAAPHTRRITWPLARRPGERQRCVFKQGRGTAQEAGGKRPALSEEKEFNLICLEGVCLRCCFLECGNRGGELPPEWSLLRQKQWGAAGRQRAQAQP